MKRDEGCVITCPLLNIKLQLRDRIQKGVLDSQCVACPNFERNGRSAIEGLVRENEIIMMAIDWSLEDISCSFCGAFGEESEITSEYVLVNGVKLEVRAERKCSAYKIIRALLY